MPFSVSKVASATGSGSGAAEALVKKMARATMVESEVFILVRVLGTMDLRVISELLNKCGYLDK